MWFDVKVVELQLERFPTIVSDVCACLFKFIYSGDLTIPLNLSGPFLEEKLNMGVKWLRCFASSGSSSPGSTQSQGLIQGPPNLSLLFNCMYILLKKKAKA